MKTTFLTRLRINGAYYLLSAVLLLLGVPLYLWLLLLPQGYAEALSAANTGRLNAYVAWLQAHLWSFAGYRLLLIVAFALVLSLPFTLFRILVAQETLGRDEEAEETQEEAVAEVVDDGSDGSDGAGGRTSASAPATAEELLAIAWPGKGFAVIAAWSGMLGILLFVLGSVASMVYLAGVVHTFTLVSGVPTSFAFVVGLLTILSSTVGGALLALASLLFGFLIARSGLRLWPPAWVAFGYLAILLAALFSASAVEVAGAPTSGQALLTTPTTLLFALWVLWFGLMLVRLQPEP
jgi:hypothetical protein